MVEYTTAHFSLLHLTYVDHSIYINGMSTVREWQDICATPGRDVPTPMSKPELERMTHLVRYETLKNRRMRPSGSDQLDTAIHQMKETFQWISHGSEAFYNRIDTLQNAVEKQNLYTAFRPLGPKNLATAFIPPGVYVHSAVSKAGLISFVMDCATMLQAAGMKHAKVQILTSRDFYPYEEGTTPHEPGNDGLRMLHTCRRSIVFDVFRKALKAGGLLFLDLSTVGDRPREDLESIAHCIKIYWNEYTGHSRTLSTAISPFRLVIYHPCHEKLQEFLELDAGLPRRARALSELFPSLLPDHTAKEMVIAIVPRSSFPSGGQVMTEFLHGPRIPLDSYLSYRNTM